MSKSSSYFAMGATLVLSIAVGWSLSPNSPLKFFAKPAKASQIAPYVLTQTSKVNFDQEIAFYRKRIQANPEGFMDLSSLAQVYLRQAKITGENSWYLLAEQSAKRSLANYANQSESLLILARVALARHEFKQALTLAQQAQKISPKDTGALSVFATAYLAIGDLNHAQSASQAMVERSPNLETYTQLALVKSAQGQDSAAIESFKHGISLEQIGQSESSAMARAWLGRLYARSGQFEFADDLYGEALKIQPGNPQIMALMAELKLSQNQSQEAEGLYAKAYLQQSSPTYLWGRGRALMALGQKAQALKLYSEAEADLRRELQQNEFGHRRDLARLLLEQSSRDLSESQAIKKKQEALKLMQAEIQKRQDAETVFVYAWSLARNQDWQSAEKSIEQVIASGVREAEYLSCAAWIAHALNKKQQAQIYQIAAEKLNPQFKQDPLYLEFQSK